MTDATSAQSIAVGSMDALDEVVVVSMDQLDDVIEMKWTSTADVSIDESVSTQELDIERNDNQYTSTRGRRRGRGRAVKKPINDSDVVMQRRRYMLLAVSAIPLLAASIALGVVVKNGTASSSNENYATTNKIVSAPTQQESSDTPTHAPLALVEEIITPITHVPTTHLTHVPTTSPTTSPAKTESSPATMSFLSSQIHQHYPMYPPHNLLNLAHKLDYHVPKRVVKIV